MRSCSVFVAHLFIIAALSCLPGYLVLRRLPIRVQESLVTRDVALPFAFGVSVVLICTVQLLGSMIAPGSGILVAGLYAASLAIPFVARQRGSFPMDDVLGRLALPFSLYVLGMLGLLLITPDYGTGFAFDWQLYYPNTLVYLGEAPASWFSQGLELEYFAKRTPALSLYGSFFMQLLGRDLAVFQIACLLANTLVFFPVYLIARSTFNRRAAAFSLLLVAFSPAVIRAAYVPEPKLAASFFLLFGLWLYLDGRATDRSATAMEGRTFSDACGGVALVAAFFFHPSMLFFAAGIHVRELWLRLRGQPLSTGLWTASVAAAALLCGPWFLWIAGQFGWSELVRPTVTIAEPVTMSLGSYALSRAGMIATTILAPFGLIADAMGNLAQAPVAGLRDYLDIGGNALLRTYEQTFLAGAGVCVAIAFILRTTLFTAGDSLLRTPFARGMLRPLLLTLVAGSAIGVGLHLGITDYKGHATNVMAPLFLLYVAAAGAILSRLAFSALLIAGVLLTLELLVTRVTTFMLSAGNAAAQPKAGFVTLAQENSWVQAQPAALGLALAVIGGAFIWSLTRLGSAAGVEQPRSPLGSPLVVRAL